LDGDGHEPSSIVESGLNRIEHVRQNRILDTKRVAMARKIVARWSMGDGRGSGVDGRSSVDGPTNDRLKTADH